MTPNPLIDASALKYFLYISWYTLKVRKFLKKHAGFYGYLQRIKKGATLNLLVQIFSSFGLGFASYFFNINDVEFYKIMMIWAISPLASIPIVLLSNTWDVRKYLRYGLLSYTGMALSLLFFNQYSFLIFAIFNGLTLGFFWVSFNYIFFLNSTNEQHAKDSSVYFILGPLIGIVLPPLGALIIDSSGYRALFFMTAVLSLLPLLYVRGKDFDFRITQSFRDADKAFAGLRLIEFFNGALHFFQGHFLIIYALLFLKTEYEMGGLLSFFAFISLLVSFLISYISDKFKRRMEIIYPLLIMMGVLILIMPALKSLAALVVVIGSYAILDSLSMPIRFAVLMDAKTKDIGFWRASELYENLGRVVVFAVASLFIYVGNYWVPFLVFSLMSFSFPFIISRKINSLRKLSSA